MCLEEFQVFRGRDGYDVLLVVGFIVCKEGGDLKIFDFFSWGMGQGYKDMWNFRCQVRW